MSTQDGCHQLASNNVDTHCYHLCAAEDGCALYDAAERGLCVVLGHRCRQDGLESESDWVKTFSAYQRGNMRKTGTVHPWALQSIDDLGMGYHKEVE